MPLNPVLYQTLLERFGDVRVTQQGQKRIEEYEPNPACPTQPQIVCRQRGEQYAVSCPFCGDQRHRLYLSYRYGTQDPRTGRQNHGLWFCHNERCEQNRRNRTRLRCLLTPSIGARALAQSKMAATERAAEPNGYEALAQPIVIPQEPMPVDQLPPDHPAAHYLRARQFDPAELCRVWGLCYCDYGGDARPCPTGRLVFPIFSPTPLYAAPNQQECQLIGWQARIVPGIQPACALEAKYLTASGMRKSSTLYGLPQARQVAGPAVIVEGPTDVWRCGPGAVALLGRTLSRDQELLLAHHFRGRPLVVSMDADATEAAQEVWQRLQKARAMDTGDGRVVIGRLPAGRSDPGDCTREELWAMVAEALGTQQASVGHVEA